MPRAIWKGHVVAEAEQFEEVEGNIYFPPRRSTTSWCARAGTPPCAAGRAPPITSIWSMAIRWRRTRSGPTPIPSPQPSTSRTTSPSTARPCGSRAEVRRTRPTLARPRHADSRRPVLPAGRVPHRPVAPGRARRDHPCPRRSCAARLAPLSRGALGRGPAAPPARPRGDRRGPRVRRAADVRRRPPSRSIPPGTSSARRRSGSRRRARSGWSRATTSAIPTRAASVRGRAVRRVHHRGHLRAADLPLGPDRPGDGRPARLVGRQCRRRPRLGAVLLRARQGPAGARRARPARRPAGVRPRRDRCAARCLSARGHQSCPDGPGRGRDARANASPAN